MNIAEPTPTSNRDIPWLGLAQVTQKSPIHTDRPKALEKLRAKIIIKTIIDQGL